MRSMLADLARDVQQLKEGREEKKELPPLKPLLEKTEEREESQQQRQQRARGKKAFTKPTAEEVQAYLDELGETRFTGERFFYYYESRGWMLTKNTHVSSWKGCVRTWIARENEISNNHNNNSYGQQRPQQPQQQRPAESAAERAERERQQRLRSLEAAVARKLG